MAKRRASAKQIAWRKKFAKKYGGKKHRGKKASKKKGKLCFNTIKLMKKYMRAHGYKVVRK